MFDYNQLKYKDLHCAAISAENKIDAIRALMEPPAKQKKKTGFEVKEGKAVYGKENGQKMAIEK